MPHQPLKPPTLKSSVFQYATLGPRSIRLLELIPDTHLTLLQQSNPSQFRLRHAILSPELSYAALSYTWGSPHITKQIIIDGCVFEVRKNLYEFLLVYARRKRCPLWVDAVCIDQDNLSERNEQVRMMGQVYTQATVVYIWLGDLGLDHQLIQELSRYIREFSYGPRDYRGADGQDAVVHRWVRLPREQQTRIFETASKISEVDYWTREWITQEILLAKEIELFCDTEISILLPPRQTDFHLASPSDAHSVPRAESVYHQAARSRAGRLFGQFLGYRTSSMFDSLMPTSEANQKAPTRTFYHHILHVGPGQCSLPHDHIYSLLGLVENGSEFPANYGDSMPSLLLKVLCFCSKNGAIVNESLLLIGQKLMQLLEITACDLKDSIFGGGLAAEDLYHTFSMCLLHFGTIVTDHGRSVPCLRIELDDELARALPLSATTMPYVMDCNCIACLAGTDIRSGDHVYHLEEMQIALFYRECADSDIKELELVATADLTEYEDGARPWGENTTMVHNSNRCLRQSTHWSWMLFGRICNHAVQGLTMKAILKALVSLGNARHHRNC